MIALVHMGVDITQVVLLFVLGILTILLVILGVQVYFILREFRKTVMKANKVLDDTESITKNVSAPLASLSAITTSLQAGSVFAIIKFVKNILAKDVDDTEIEEKKKK